MRKFAELYESIDATTSTNDKVDAMAEYFQSATSADSAWALYYLTGRRLKRFISSRSLRDWTLELTQVREW
ncbi:MAG: ATP-dependent DNA ligase, partial [Proteobacteria bacterium]